MGYRKGVGGAVDLVSATLKSGQQRISGLVIDALGISRVPTNPAPPTGPSIVVLPFSTPHAEGNNGGGDDDAEYVREGFTDDIITALGTTSRYLFVIANDAAFAYKDSSLDVQEIGRRLGVRYVLQGTISLEHETLGVTARLLEASSQDELWSEKYERPIQDIQALRAEITERILIAVGAGVEAAELERMRSNPIQSIGAVEAIWGGTYHLRQVTRVDLKRSRELLEHAIDLDPGLLNAYAFLAGTYTQEFSNGWSADRSLLDRAEQLAKKAIETDTPTSAGYAILGIVHILREEWEDGIRCEDLAIELEPNVMWPHALRGMALAEGKKWREATKSIKQALRLAPVPAHGLLIMLAYINYGAGRRDEAVELLEQVRVANLDNILVRIALAAFYSRQRRVDDAKTCVQEILAVNPDMTVEWAMELIPGLEGVAGRREFEQYPQNLNEAGLPLTQQLSVGSDSGTTHSGTTHSGTTH